MSNNKIIKTIAIILSLIQLTGCTVVSLEESELQINSEDNITNETTEATFVTIPEENDELILTNTSDKENTEGIITQPQQTEETTLYDVPLNISNLLSANFNTSESKLQINIPEMYDFNENIKIFPTQVVSWQTKLILPTVESGQKWYYDMNTYFTGYMGSTNYSSDESSITIEELYNNTRAKTCESYGWNIEEDKSRFMFYICMEEEDKSIRYVIPITIADIVTNIQPIMGYNKLLTFSEDVEYFTLNFQSSVDYWNQDPIKNADMINYYESTKKSISGIDYGIFTSSQNINSLSAGEPVHMSFDSDGKFMADYTGDQLASDIKDGKLIFYRVANEDRKGTWRYIDLSQYQPYIIDKCSWNDEDAPKDTSIKTAETVSDILNCFPQVIDVKYCDGSVRTEIAHYNFFSDDEEKYPLCAPGDASINGVTNEGYSIELYCDNGSSFTSGIGAFEYYEFSPTLSKDEIIIALDALNERQEELGVKTGGLLSTYSVSYGSKILRKINFNALTRPVTETPDEDNYIVTTAIPEETYATATLIPEDRPKADDEIETAIPEVSETTAVITTTVTEKETEETTTSGQQASEEHNEEMATTIQYELGKPVYVESSFGTIRINGDDPAQIKIAANMLDYKEEFLIPVEDYLAPYKSQYDLVYAALYANIQNPYTPTIANLNCETVAEDGKQYLKYNIEYGEARKYTQKWMPEIYNEVKKIAKEIESKNYATDRDKFEAINEELTSRAEYNYKAMDACSDGLVQTVLTLPEEYQSAWSAYGVLCQGEGVCQSYAEAYKLISDELGLKCISVTGKLSGGGHIWNKVCIDDEWYIMDSTNNDGTDDDELKQAVSNAYCFVSDKDTSTMLIPDDVHWCLNYNKNDFAATDSSLNYWITNNQWFNNDNFVEQYNLSNNSIWAGYCKENGISSVQDFVSEIVLPKIELGELDKNEFLKKKVGVINNIYFLY